jgi:four helix bundle protein
MKSHKDLNVWKNAVSFVSDIYKITESFPNSELFGLTNQIRRAAVSIPSNIAEGAARASQKEFNQFLSISLGSTAEVETQLLIAMNLKFISTVEYKELTVKIDDIRKMLIGLKKSLQ